MDFVDNAKRFHQAGNIQTDSFFCVKSFQKDFVCYNICYIKIDSESYKDYNNSDDMSQQRHSDSLQ